MPPRDPYSVDMTTDKEYGLYRIEVTVTVIHGADSLQEAQAEANSLRSRLSTTASAFLDSTTKITTLEKD